MKIKDTETATFVLENAKTQMVLGAGVDVEELIDTLAWALDELGYAERALEDTETATFVLENAKTQMVLGVGVDVEELIDALAWALDKLADQTAESLAKAVQHERMDCDDAIQQQLDDTYRGELETPSLEIAHAALCYFNRGQMDRSLDLPDGPLTVAEVIEEFGLEPFAAHLNDQEPDRHGEVSYPFETLVDYEGEVCRVIGRRRVTIQAMPHEDEFEVFIEQEDGKPLYFVGESMVEPMEEGEDEEN